MANSEENRSGSGGVGASGVDEAAWARNQALAHNLAVARERLERGRDAGVGGTRLARLERGVANAGEAIYIANRGLARRIARRYARLSGDADDIYQVADEALWVSINRWDPQRSPLASWAFQHIEKSCRGYVSRTEHGYTIWSWERRPAVLAAARNLAAAGKTVDAESVAAAAEVTPALAAHILERERAGANRSLDAPVGDGGSTLGDIVLNSEDLEPSRDYDDAEIAAAAAAAAALTIYEKAAFVRSSGLDGAKAVSTETFGQFLPVTSAETARRAVNRAHDALTALERQVTGVGVEA